MPATLKPKVNALAREFVRLLLQKPEWADAQKELGEHLGISQSRVSALANPSRSDGTTADVLFRAAGMLDRVDEALEAMEIPRGARANRKAMAGVDVPDAVSQAVQDGELDERAAFGAVVAWGRPKSDLPDAEWLSFVRKVQLAREEAERLAALHARLPARRPKREKPPASVKRPRPTRVSSD